MQVQPAAGELQESSRGSWRLETCVDQLESPRLWGPAPGEAHTCTSVSSSSLVTFSSVGQRKLLPASGRAHTFSEPVASFHARPGLSSRKSFNFDEVHFFHFLLSGAFAVGSKSSSTSPSTQRCSPSLAYKRFKVYILHLNLLSVLSYF